MIGPVTLTPVLYERVWGRESLPAWLPLPASPAPIGEAWLTADACVGPNGKTLADWIKSAPAAFGGSEFPLLIKLIFPRERLSVQVHPNDAQAQAAGLPRGKTECWYIVEAEPGATVAVGLQQPMDEAALRQAIADGSIEKNLRHLPVQPGDMVYVEAGTLHTIGPGVTILETQQNSDVTYRLYDFGRPRELHLEQGLAVCRDSAASGLVAPVPMQGFARLVASPYFVVDRFSAGEHTLGPQLQVLVALGEEAFLDDLPLPRGHAVVLPAEAVTHRLRIPQNTEVLRMFPGIASS